MQVILKNSNLIKNKIKVDIKQLSFSIYIYMYIIRVFGRFWPKVKEDNLFVLRQVRFVGFNCDLNFIQQI